MKPVQFVTLLGGVKTTDIPPGAGPPPSGQVYVKGTDGQFLKGADGNYLTVPA